jgi:esterase
MSLKLHSEIIGSPSNPDFIIAHGLFGSTSNWRSIAKQLSDRFRVHCLDLRNHGQSPWDDEMSYGDLAGDIENYIRSGNLKSPHILGHSMGGKACMVLVQTFDLDLNQVFIVDIAPVAYQHDHDDLINALVSLDLEDLISRKEADEKLSATISSQPIRQFLLQNLKRGEMGFEWRINLSAIVANKPEIFGFPPSDPVSNSMVFIAGGASTYISNDSRAAILKAFPNSILKTIPSAGHWLHAEQPQTLLNIINKHT